MHSIFRIQLYDAFLKAEQRDIIQNVLSAHKLFEQNISEFNKRFADWSNWDDAYGFIQNPSPQFIQGNLNNESISNLQVNLMVFADPAGRIVFLKGFDLAKNQEISLDQEEITKKILKQSLLDQAVKENRNFSGVTILSSGALQIAIRPVLTSKNEGPAQGVLVVGRYLNDMEVNRLSRLLGFSIHLDCIERPDHHPDFSEVTPILLKQNLSDPNAVVVKHLSMASIAGYALLNDIEGHLALVLRVTNSRETHRQYQIAMIFFLVSMISVALLAILIAFIFLRQFVLSPLALLGSRVNKIHTTQELSLRLPVKGNDELSLLAGTINQMLQRIEQDFAEKRDLESRMVQSQKMAAVGQMAAGIAHEIRNPIMVIQGFSELALKGEYPGEQAKESFKTIHNEATRCSRIVQDLLTFSRKGNIERESVDFNQMVEEALSVVATRFKMDNIMLTKDFAPSLPPLAIYKNRLQQVIVNLCNNAADAMKQKKTIQVSTRKAALDQKEGLGLTIQDSGEGMPPDVVKKIFDPFFTTKPVGKGTGLGLSLVYEIVEQHHGRICVDSKVGEGTTFYLFFPFSN